MAIDYVACDGPCADCRRDDICCDSFGRPLCNDCWHSARYKAIPYAVFRDADGFCWSRSSYLKAEAEERAAHATAEDERSLAFQIAERDDPNNDEARTAHYRNSVEHTLLTRAQGWGKYTAKPCPSWFGDRWAHPGYMAKRRRELGAA